MERLKMMKENLMACVQGQLGNLQEVDAKELGEAIDMIKDLEEAMYYCSVVKAMEESDKEKKDKSSTMRYTYPPVMYEDGMMQSKYYDGGRNGNQGGRMYYQPSPTQYSYPMMNENYPYEIRDSREGRSPISRRNYMESKELRKDKKVQMTELEKYMNELTRDIMEMIEDASPEEKTILSQKISTLAEKIK